MSNNKKIIIGAVFAVAVLLGGISAYKMTGKGDSGIAYAESGDSSGSKIAGDTAWFVRCNDEEGKEAKNKRGKCEMFQRQDMKESGQRVLEFAIGYPEGSDEARGIVILPLGLHLPAGAQVKVDENEALPLQIRTCVPQGCMAYLKLDDKAMNIMKKGNKATVLMVTGEGKTIGIEVPLKGFSRTLGEISS